MEKTEYERKERRGKEEGRELCQYIFKDYSGSHKNANNEIILYFYLALKQNFAEFI